MTSPNDAQTVASIMQAQGELREPMTADEVDKQWREWCTIEVMIRNPQVSETVEHWENRALKAEAEVDALRSRIAQLEGEIFKMASLAPEQIDKVRAGEYMAVAPIYYRCIEFAKEISDNLRSRGQRLCDCGQCPQGLCCCSNNAASSPAGGSENG
jgi:hypothetical protein